MPLYERQPSRSIPVNMWIVNRGAVRRDPSVLGDGVCLILQYMGVSAPAVNLEYEGLVRSRYRSSIRALAVVVLGCRESEGEWILKYQVLSHNAAMLRDQDPG
jgi:hypothetical protein